MKISLNLILIIISLSINLVLLIWIIILSLKIRTQRAHNQKASKALKQGKYPELVEKNTRALENVTGKVDDLYSLNGKLNKKIEESYRNIGLVRFNAFSETGGDLSYSLALLDDKGSGIIITSLHGREDSHTFVKNVFESKGTPELSEEEEQAVIKAMEEQR